MVVCENHVQAGMLDAGGAIDRDLPAPPGHVLLRGSSVPDENPDGVRQPVPDAVVAALDPPAHITYQPMQTPPVQHPLALLLCLHVPVTTLLGLPRWLPPKVPRIGHPEAEPHGNNKMVIWHEVGWVRRWRLSPATSRPEVNLVIHPELG